MSRHILGPLCGLLVAACSVGEADSSSAPLAGETARAYGIDRYEVSVDGSRIELLGADGGSLGEISIAVTDRIDGEGEDAIHANRVVTFQDRAGLDAPAELLVAVPTPFAIMVDVESAWQAAVTDPALAEVLAQHELAFAPRADVAYYGCSYGYSQDCGGAYYCNQADAGDGGEWQSLRFSSCFFENCESQDKFVDRYCRPECVGGAPSPCGAPYGARGCYVWFVSYRGNGTCSDYNGDCSSACRL